VQGLIGVLAALLGVLLVPLALAGGTAWLLLPAHFVFAGACSLGALLAGLSGHPGRVRAFGGGYLVASLAAVVALSVGSEVRQGSWYWMLPWAGVLVWAWVPPLVTGFAGAVAGGRRRRRIRRVVRRRRKRAARDPSAA
jgi:hypothetical protein